MPYLDQGWPNLPAMMLARAREWPTKPLFRYWRNKAWQSLHWAEFAGQVAALAAFLRAQGIAPGDRVLLVSENRPEFPIADTAIMAIGAMTASANCKLGGTELRTVWVGGFAREA
jgi:long-chain acyl-CoA synthetase